MRTRHSLEQYRDGILAGDRAMLAKAITLVESLRADDRALGRALVKDLAAKAPRAHRIGVTGVPGVGKSTFLDTFGTARCREGHKVAVLAVDPSSEVSGGSILGDKTRMNELARHPNAYIRPSPSGLALGGVARRTREAIVLCEAAGFDIVFVETVGVGQSETTVASMVDVFLFLALPGAGDELQGIKKGILELADLVVVHKADGDARASAEEAKHTHEAALHYARGTHGTWHPRALLASSRTGEGLAEVWAALEEHRRDQVASGDLEARRRTQEVRAFWALVEEGLRARFDADPHVKAALGPLLERLAAGAIDAGSAADALLAIGAIGAGP
jgi:LAO/AO transport system kinase